MRVRLNVDSIARDGRFVECPPRIAHWHRPYMIYTDMNRTTRRWWRMRWMHKCDVTWRVMLMVPGHAGSECIECTWVRFFSHRRRRRVIFMLYVLGFWCSVYSMLVVVVWCVHAVLRFENMQILQQFLRVMPYRKLSKFIYPTKNNNENVLSKFGNDFKISMQPSNRKPIHSILCFKTLSAI